MRKQRKKTNNWLLISLAACFILVFSVIVILPYGSCVRVVAAINDDNVDIYSCYLKKLSPLSIIDPDNTITVGNNTIKMIVLNAETQKEIFSTNKTNIGTGKCPLETPTLKNLESNTELLVKLQLLDINCNLIAQKEITIIYK